MWLLPSYGRPAALLAVRQAPAGLPADVVVLVNEDDPKREEYVATSPWRIHFVPAGSRVCDAMNEAVRAFPDKPFYGFLSDDLYPMTEGWEKKMVDAAGKNRVAIANGSPMFPLIRSAVVIGGDLLRAVGFFAPPGFRHNYADNVWDTIVSDFDLGVPLEDVVIEHRHHIFGKAKADATYARGSADINEDRARFQAWMVSPERVAMSERLGKFLGRNVTVLETKGINLVICLPFGDGRAHRKFQRCLDATTQLLGAHGVQTRTLELSGSSNIGKARERLLWDAMKVKPTHLMYIDSDMTWDPHLVLDLLAAGHDFCGVPGALKQEKPKLACNFLPNPQHFHKRTRYLKVRDIGFAFVMLKRSVIERMCAANPDLRYSTGDGSEQYALFMEMIDRDFDPAGDRLSEDLSFCRRWSRTGGAIFIDPNARLGHIGEQEYGACAADFFDHVEDDQVGAVTAYAEVAA